MHDWFYWSAMGKVAPGKDFSAGVRCEDGIKGKDYARHQKEAYYCTGCNWMLAYCFSF